MSRLLLAACAQLCELVALNLCALLCLLLLPVTHLVELSTQRRVALLKPKVAPARNGQDTVPQARREDQHGTNTD